MDLPGIRGHGGFQRFQRDFQFRGRVVSVSVDHVRLPGGHEARHEVIHLPAAVAIVPLLERAGSALEVVLVEQFRSSVGGYIHEIPAGILEDGEAPVAGAARELEEETGYRPSRLQRLASLFPIPGTSAHQMHFYLAEGLTAGEQRLEPGECLTVKPVPLDLLIRSALDPAGAPGEDGGGVILVDGKTHIGILYAALLRGRGNAPGT